MLLAAVLLPASGFALGVAVGLRARRAGYPALAALTVSGTLGGAAAVTLWLAAPGHPDTSWPVVLVRAVLVLLGAVAGWITATGR